jgi:hypothetical protein
VFWPDGAAHILIIMWKHKYFKPVLNVKLFNLLFTFLLLTFCNPAIKLILLPQRIGHFFGSLVTGKPIKGGLIFFLLFSLHAAAQQTDTAKVSRTTTVSGRIVDDA